MIVYNSDAVNPGNWDNPTEQDIHIMDQDGSDRINLTNTAVSVRSTPVSR